MALSGARSIGHRATSFRAGIRWRSDRFLSPGKLWPAAHQII